MVRHLTGLVYNAAINGADPDYVLYWNDEDFAVAKKAWSDYSFDFHLLKSLEKCGKREHKSAHLDQAGDPLDQLAPQLR